MKKSLIKTGLAVIAATGLSGCASISQDQCVAGNWAERGYNDGLAGKSKGKLSDYAKDCGEFNILPDSEAYLNAYEEGLVGYCTYDRGFNRGEKGDSYNQVCSGQLALDFRPGYDEGKQIYEIRNTHENLIERYEDTIRAIDDVSYRLGDENLSDDERLRLRKKLRRLEDKLDDCKRDLRSHERRYNLRRYRTGY